MGLWTRKPIEAAHEGDGALECGYGSIGPFNRAFRQRFGMTPTEHRGAARMERHRHAT